MKNNDRKTGLIPVPNRMILTERTVRNHLLFHKRFKNLHGRAEICMAVKNSPEENGGAFLLHRN